MEWLRYGKQYYPNRICMNNYTYQDIYSAVVNVATRLQTLADTRIAIVSDNSVTMAVYLLAAMLVRKEVLLLNVHLTAGEIEISYASCILQPCYTVLSDVDKYLNR